jgi:O-antigen ligase
MIARSRAGLILAAIGLVAGVVMCAVNQSGGGWLKSGRLLALSVIGVVALTSQYALVRILDRLGDDPLKDARIAFARNTWRAGQAFWPFGSGAGTFVPVYALFEPPQDALIDAFANRAHNDVLEALLETGAAGFVLGLLFSGWVFRRVWIVWWRGLPGGRMLDQQFSRAAAVAVVLMLAHSVVDYPLRTGAMMAVFVLCCALLCVPVEVEDVAEQNSARDQVSRPQSRRRQIRGHAGQADGSAPAAPAGPGTPGGVWGGDLDWPEAWKNRHGRRN